MGAGHGHRLFFHGHSRVHRALLGSVSEKVLHKAKVPVLMLRSYCDA